MFGGLFLSMQPVPLVVLNAIRTIVPLQLFESPWNHPSRMDKAWRNTFRGSQRFFVCCRRG
jgi:hypothetical protein